MNIRTIETRVNEFLASNRGCAFYVGKGARLFTGVSAGTQRSTHALFARFPGMIEGHRSPDEFFQHDFPDGVSQEELSVISFAFHINPLIVKDNSLENLYPSFSWLEARHKFDYLYRPFIEFIGELLPGKRITVPVKSTLYRADLKKNIPVANWSERHAAFACGLGTFGLHGALITKKGCTHRLLGIIVDAAVEGCVEPPEHPYGECRHFMDGSCGECMTRCPVGAIVPGKHIIERCYEHEWLTCRARSSGIYGTEVPACGLCMCGVPCDISSPL
jgi:epoxyqueuosine reductase QueG